MANKRFFGGCSKTPPLNTRIPRQSFKGVQTLTVIDGVLTLEAKDIKYEKGSQIWIQVKGFEGNNSDSDDCRTQVMLEYYNGYFQVHVWNNSENSETFEIEPRPEYRQVMDAKKRDLPKLIHVTDPDAKELLNKRLKGEA